MSKGETSQAEKRRDVTRTTFSLIETLISYATCFLFLMQKSSFMHSWPRD